MTENSRFWDGTTIGDATEAPYNAPDEFAAVLRSLNGANANTSRSGVCRGELNTLTCTGAATPISVNTGRAFVHGSWYESDASVSFNIADPNPNSRIDTLVLRKTWSTQQVRLAVLTGSPSATPVAPTLTQDATVTKIWEFPLYDIYVASGGAITLVDRREYVPYLSAQQFTRLSDTTLAVAAAVVSLPITSGYRMYMAVVNSRINTAAHSAETLGLYFTPTTLTDYDWAVLQTYGSPPLSHSAPGLYSTWYLDVGNVGESNPSLTKYPQSVIFMTNLNESLDKYVYTLGVIGSSSLNVAMQAGTFRYPNPVLQVNFCIPAGDQFAIGSRFTLYGIY